MAKEHAKMAEGMAEGKMAGDSRIKKHDSSKAHMEACIVYDQWRRCKTIDKENDFFFLKESNFLEAGIAKNCQCY